MKQTELGLDLTHRKTRKAVFLEEMERVVPWVQLLALIEHHAPRKERGRPPFAIEAMLRIHFLQQWFGLPDVAIWKKPCLTCRCTGSSPLWAG